MTDKIIRNTLKDDLAVRQSGSKLGKLHLLSSINRNNDYDYSFPTIISDKTVSMKNAMIRDTKIFKKVFDTKYFKYVSKLDYNNVLIAGGSIGSVLLQQELNNDIDIFVYGLSLEGADAKAGDIILQLYASYEEYIIAEKEKKESGENKLNIIVPTEANVINVRNKHCISVNFNDGGKIQIILRLYDSIEQILYGFDLGSSAVGYNGSEVYFTMLGKISYEYMINIIDPSRRSTTYESRLIKYYSRGFSIIFPDLDIKRLRTNYFKYGMMEVAELPYFPFSYRDIKGNKIYHGMFISTKEHRCKTDNATDNNELKPIYHRPSQLSDYQSNNMNEYQIFYLNLRNLVRDGQDYYYYSEDMNLDIIDNMPYITSSRIIDFYDKLSESIYTKCTFDVKTFSTYFSKNLIQDVVNQLYYEKNYGYLTELIEEQKRLILDRFEKVKQIEHQDLPWITVDPGTQLTGSFNPILSDSSDWYGYYYIETVLKDEYNSNPVAKTLIRKSPTEKSKRISPSRTLPIRHNLTTPNKLTIQ